VSLVPTQTVYTIKRGSRGVVVWAVQRALNSAGQTVTEDGIFGEETQRIVRRFQEATNLTVDGSFGPATSAKMAAVLGKGVSVPVPVGLVRGVVNAESGNLIGAVNASVPGGIDCGYTQRRVLAADYDDEQVVHRAFDGRYQMSLLAKSLRSRHDAFFGRPGARTHELAWRLATLNHNYPYGADKISRVGISGLSSYWTTPQSWVIGIGAKFSDGQPVRTPLDWCQRYALGSSAHADPGFTTQFVSDWSS